MRRAALAEAERQIAEELRIADRLRHALMPPLREAVASLRARGGIGRAWLFGSYAWGKPSEESDVDVLVEGCADVLTVAGEIGSATRLDVHVLERAQAPAELVARVDAEGLPL